PRADEVGRWRSRRAGSPGASSTMASRRASAAPRPGTADRWASLAARAPATIVFAVLGLSSGTWAARIPAIKSALHLSPGALGLTRPGPARGRGVARPWAGAVLATVPPRRGAQCGLVFLAGSLPLTTVVSSPWQLFAVLAGWGAGLGVVDVGINVEASAVQDRL